MVWIAGADGCKKGWFRVSRETETEELRFNVLGHARDLLETFPQPTVLGLDIPIGLPEAGQRECDRLARKCIGPRRSSVFPSPIRPALHAKTREEASLITQKQDGRRVGVQSWAINPKIREVDELLQSNPGAKQQIYEVHPEVCFWSWSGRQPMNEHKRKPGGKKERLKLIEPWLGSNVLIQARDSHLKKDLADDDIMDAIAALWTADRIARGKAETLPEEPPEDQTGLRMAITY
jgi:predicted RNase H-like nuclease